MVSTEKCLMMNKTNYIKCLRLYLIRVGVEI